VLISQTNRPRTTKIRTTPAAIRIEFILFILKKTASIIEPTEQFVKDQINPVRKLGWGFDPTLAIIFTPPKRQGVFSNGINLAM
jgi:hypothetical protein